MRSFIAAALCATLAAATPAPPANDCPTDNLTQVFSDGTTCVGTCRGDRHGGDYKAVYSGTFLKCASICAAEPFGQCFTVQYNEGNGYCYLKNVVNNLDTTTTNTDTWDCCPGPVTTSTSAGTTVCTPKCGTDRQGGDYNRAPVRSFDQCVALCGQDPQCVTAQYHVSNGFCYLKNVVNAPNTDLGVETVDCVFTPASG